MVVLGDRHRARRHCNEVGALVVTEPGATVREDWSLMPRLNVPPSFSGTTCLTTLISGRFEFVIVQVFASP